ncbi:hypothetical protein [Prolixibacter sp. NT017]|uniref:hypothetical protein n=1 Tax=Prolixibacter sp. NT017 TaxID=2652390 RepID=UPI00127F1F9D|nr:hypothetical protein [Prolixibacter sp. NT017]GET24557.1 hypothetical protein NT017_08860 [Prolixibacter sp. NT017]
MADNEKLRMKFKLHQLEFELEGDQEVVKEQFETFKLFITNDLLPKINVQTLQEAEPIEDKPIPQIEQHANTVIDLNEIPTLQDVKLRDLAKNETDWLLVYIYYASEGGTKEFTRANLLQLYRDSNRYTDNKRKSLSQYIKNIVKAQYIKSTNDTNFILLEKGKMKAHEIFDGKSKSSMGNKVVSTTKKISITKKEKSNRKQVSVKQGFKLDRNLNLHPEGKQSLMDFAEGYKMNSMKERILVIVYYLKEILELESMNPDHIYTGFEKLNIRVPKSLYQLISDTKNKKGWLEFDTMENIGLSIQGRNAIKYDLAKHE